MGYHRAGFDVVGVDHMPQPRYPFTFVQADALDYCREHGHEFDVIHASPPCQAYGTLAAINRARGLGGNHPRLIDPTRDALIATGAPWVIENVVGAPMQTVVLLCGSMFALRVRRHRLFESSVMLIAPSCQHDRQGRVIGVYGNQGSWALRAKKHGGGFHRAANTAEASAAMGIDWMTWKELTQAIPPAYTELIGRQLLAAVQS